MRLASLTIENYRSITKAYKVQLGSMTVLLGPNNEGKSNVLRALATALNILSQAHGPAHAYRPSLRRYWVDRIYNWRRDFPIALQASRPDGLSIVVLEFKLTDDERSAFKTATGSKLTGTLPIKVSVDRK